jgi:O-antigen ligase
MKSAISSDFSYRALSLIWLFALLNPIFKKYDYGAGYPLIIVFSCLLVFISFLEWRKKRETANLEKISLLAFCTFIFLSFIFSSTKTVGFSEVLAFVSMTAFYLIFAFQKIDWGEKMIRFICFGGVLTVLLGYSFYFFWPEPRMVGGFFSTLYHAHNWPNAFALFLLMIWPLFLLLDFKLIKKSRFLRPLLLGFVLSGLLLTFSRGAMIAFTGQLVLLGLLFRKEIKGKKVMVAVLAGLFALGLFGSANTVRNEKHEIIDVGEKMAFENQESLTSGQERLDFWQGAIQLAIEEPWFGHGPFSFRYSYNPIQKELLANSDHPHNFLLKIWSENGSLALASFLVFLVTLTTTVWDRYPMIKKRNKLVVKVLGVAVAGALAHSMIDYNFNFFANLFLFFFFLVMMRSLVIKKADHKQRNITAVWLSLIIGIIALVEGGILILSEIGGEDELQYSLYPRNYYLNEADRAVQNLDFATALVYLAKETELNPLSDRAYFLRSAIYCSDTLDFYNLDLCRLNIQNALGLNALNDINYHKQYLLAFADNISDEDLDSMTRVLERYMEFVALNVHFTAYTDNVESAAALVDTLEDYLDPESFDQLNAKKEEMLVNAERIRSEKTF